MLNEMIYSLREALAGLASGVATFVPRAVVALLIVIIGWALARAVAWIVRRLLTWLPMDRLAERLAVAEALRLAELPTASRVIAAVTFWVVWFVFLAQAFETLRLPGFEDAGRQLAGVIGRIIGASLILVVGIFASHVIWKASLLGAFNAGLPSPRLLAAGLRILVLAITILTALAQLGVPLVIVLTAFSIAFGALMLGLALAFGLGGRDAARERIERHVRGTQGTPRETETRSHL